MTSIRIGTKVMVKKYGYASLSMAGRVGKVTEIEYGSEFDKYTVYLLEPDMGSTVPNSQSGLLKSDLEVLPGDRIEGEDILAEDIKVGDTIEYYRNLDRGILETSKGLVSKIKSEDINIGERNCKKYTHFQFLTEENGIIYSTWWNNFGKSRLVKAAPEPHPVDVAENGDYFSFTNILGVETRLTKFRDNYWVKESNQPNQEVDHVSMETAGVVKSIFNTNNCTMQ